MNPTDFDTFFKKATGFDPFPFQRTFAEASSLPQIVRAPTGLGKTAMAIICWLWRRFTADEKLRADTPRRLVYCLPMRVLVEQIRECALDWLDATGLLAGTVEREPPKNGRRGRVKAATYRWNDAMLDQVAVHALMGGEHARDWDIHPEANQILIGTQDMLLSRALNRGYAASRARWPIQFGLLHTDCLWVFDEIQLMGAGLATSAQLEAFRRKLPHQGAESLANGHRCRSVWMSATMQREWLGTVDLAPRIEGLTDLELTDDDHACQEVQKRWKAGKRLRKANAVIGETRELSHEVREVHLPGTRTIVIVNTVKRAHELFEVLNGKPAGRSKGKKGRDIEKGSDAAAPSTPRTVLLHSRFRAADRKRQVDEALAPIQTGEPGMIVVSTQVVEAGVDVSATTLFTELAPWASLVQRFGRCNRVGEDREKKARVFWLDLPGKAAAAQKMAAPYEAGKLDESRERLKELKDAGLRSLPSVELPFEHAHVMRRRDLIDLFDTTPDLAGNDIDIDRFVREADDSDVRVFWRDWDQKERRAPSPDEPAPRADEFCPAPIGQFRAFVKDQKGKVWRWNFLDKKWDQPNAHRITPGQVFLVHADAGGYTRERGWEPESRDRVEPVNAPGETNGDEPEATDDDPLSRAGVWQTIAEHAEQVCDELDGIVKKLTLRGSEVQSLRHAARWHDRGKAHDVFQSAIDDGEIIERGGHMVHRCERPRQWQGCRFVAKAPRTRKDADGRILDQGFWRSYDWIPGKGRRHFRHELASALAVLLARDGLVPEAARDLVAYLVAAHHGKVRLSIRSLPSEMHPPGANRRFARGIWDGDQLPEADLGGGVVAPPVTLSLEPMELGLCMEPPFAGEPSWAERMLHSRDALGPFRLAYLEAILRAADWRASRKAETT